MENVEMKQQNKVVCVNVGALHKKNAFMGDWKRAGTEEG